MATLRVLHAALVSAAGLAGVVAVVLPATEADAPAALFAAIIVADAFVSLGMILWSRRRPLDTSSPAALATSYRGAYVLSLGLAFAPAMVGLIGAIVTARDWLGLLGVGLSLVGLGWVSPRGDVARRQAEISATGSPLSLEAALDGRAP